jgi:uncharacterized membrane protein
VARFEHSVSIEAPAERVWATWTDVERWPEWAPPMKKVELQTDGELRPGSRARIEAEGGPPSVWEVTSLSPGTSFEWKTNVRGVTIVGGHEVRARGNASEVTASIEYRGILSLLFRPMLMRVAKRNVPSECEGLKRRCEAASLSQAGLGAVGGA